MVKARLTLPNTMMRMDGSNHRIVIDADALIALVNVRDALHERALQVNARLIEQQAFVLFPSSAILEAVTKLQRVLSTPALVEQLLALVFHDKEAIVPVDFHILNIARSYFNPQASKQNTLFDCAVAAIASEYGARAIFSFDAWYTKRGFQLTEALL